MLSPDAVTLRDVRGQLASLPDRRARPPRRNNGPVARRQGSADVPRDDPARFDVARTRVMGWLNHVHQRLHGRLSEYGDRGDVLRQLWEQLRAELAAVESVADADRLQRVLSTYDRVVVALRRLGDPLDVPSARDILHRDPAPGPDGAVRLLRSEVLLRRLGLPDAVGRFVTASPADRPGVLFDIATKLSDKGESLAVLAEMVAAEAATTTDAAAGEAGTSDFTVSLLKLVDRVPNGLSPAELETFSSTYRDRLDLPTKFLLVEALGAYQRSRSDDLEKAAIGDIAAAVLRC
ncbi:hypothetical protein [Actinoplanes sp. NBRC 103695]|uniref:hypothetical protein n=1 Tax=Actinoplanes sp. NBRC 103695 TaxID=3032202 RepID=UPI0025533C32|nr:hypothetical protein [Actinoplanes sp. NBRC 103695]